MEKYYQENQALAESFLKHYFFEDFQKKNLYDKHIELIISPKCNLGCKYCYVHKNRKKIFDEKSFTCEDGMIENLKHILRWIEINKFTCPIEIFSGELLAQEVGFRALETIYEHQKNLPEEYRTPSITIPTNFTFICSEEATKRVDEIREKFKSLNIYFGLSASFDGKYMEQNRPYLKDLDIPLGGVRDDAYYDRVFEYCAKTYTGLHPMIYSKGIDLWIDNFLWFQEQMEKHDIPWNSIYLLHVRNEEWTLDQVHQFQDFIRFLFKFIWDKVEHNHADMCDFILRDGFNLLMSSFTRTGRGLTCGIQSALPIRVSDLSVSPCHRLGYSAFKMGHFEPDEEKGLVYVNKNVELLISTFAVHKESFPVCTECPINQICSGQCLGACFESNGNMYTPIPSVCAVSHALAATCVEQLKKYEVLNLVLDRLDSEIRDQILYVEKELLHYA